MISKAKVYFLDLLIKEIYVYTVKNHFCVIWKKNRRNGFFNGVEEMERNFKYVKNIINKDILSQSIRYRISNHETKDHLEKLFVFD